MCIYKRLQEACSVKGLKLKEFIEITKLPYRTGQSYLNGNREPNPAGMQIICTQMGINLNWLVTGVGEMFVNSTSNVDNNDDEQKLINNFRKTNDTGKKAILATAEIMAKELQES